MDRVATRMIHPAPADAERDDEVLAGRAAAERLTDEWPDVSWVPEAPSETWARAAVERFGELIREQRAIFRASQKKSERGAAKLSPRPAAVCSTARNWSSMRDSLSRFSSTQRPRTK